MDKKFNIELRTTFAEAWRYNITITAGCFSSSGEQLQVVSEQAFVAPAGANLQAPPDKWSLPCEVKLSTEACASIVTYIYIVAHTLPSGREIEDAVPFDLNVKVSSGREVIYKAVHKINQWSGASIELKLPVQ